MRKEEKGKEKKDYEQEGHRDKYDGTEMKNKKEERSYIKEELLWRNKWLLKEGNTTKRRRCQDTGV